MDFPLRKAGQIVAVLSEKRLGAQRAANQRGVVVAGGQPGIGQFAVHLANVLFRTQNPFRLAGARLAGETGVGGVAVPGLVANVVDDAVIRLNVELAPLVAYATRVAAGDAFHLATGIFPGRAVAVPVGTGTIQGGCTLVDILARVVAIALLFSHAVAVVVETGFDPYLNGLRAVVFVLVIAEGAGSRCCGSREPCGPPPRFCLPPV